MGRRYSIDVEIKDGRLRKAMEDVDKAAALLHQSWFALSQILDMEIPATDDDGEVATE